MRENSGCAKNLDVLIVPCESSFTARTINPIKKLVKITKLSGYIPLVQGYSK
jgi:hypothetical protein